VDNQVRLQLFVLTYNLGNFLRQAVLPQSVRHWTLTTLREKIDQDWGEGCAPFSEDRLSDGGGGGSARVVPDDFGTDWPVEIGNCNVRMRVRLNNQFFAWA